LFPKSAAAATELSNGRKERKGRKKRIGIGPMAEFEHSDVRVLRGQFPLS
jgi:hypothetical protein